MVEKKEFSARLVQLRMNKGVSARDMSLSIGQSPGYINNIENGVNYPSITVFFYICEYLDVTPAEFFDTDNVDPVKSRELIDAVRGISSENLDHIISIAKCIKR